MRQRGGSLTAFPTISFQILVFFFQIPVFDQFRVILRICIPLLSVTALYKEPNLWFYQTKN